MAKTSRSRPAARRATSATPTGSPSRPAGAGSPGHPGATGGATHPGGTRRDSTGAGRRSRRERERVASPSFLQRYRFPILGVVAVVAVAIGAFVLSSSASPAYACSAEFQPSASADPSDKGAVEDDMGRNHVAVGQSVTYPLCPPASGNHYNAAGEGPIAPRLYGPNEATVPQGWVHNLEHGGLVVLYRCTAASDTGCSDSSQAAMGSFVSSFPTSPVCKILPGQISPVVTRFDQMPKPYAAIVWGRVLYLDSFDTKAIMSFYEQEGERTNPEPQCASPMPATASPTASPSPS